MTSNSSNYTILGSSSKKFADHLKKINAEELSIKNFELPLAVSANEVAIKDINEAQIDWFKAGSALNLIRSRQLTS